MYASKLMIGIVTVSVVLAGALIACQNGDETSSDDANITADGEPIPTADELLADAIAAAQSRDQLGCDGDADLLNIARTVADALDTNDTPEFRKKVTGNPDLSKALARTLDWQTFLGVYDADKPETIVPALSADVILWGKPVSAGVPSQRLELHAGGKASLFTFNAPDDGSDVAPKDAQYTELPTTWSLDPDGVTFHVGDDLVFTLRQHDEVTLNAVGDAKPTFYSMWRECGS